MKNEVIDRIIEEALQEDMPKGDITSENVIPPDSVSDSEIIAKEEGVLAGIDVVCRVFQRIDSSIAFEKFFEDGQIITKGDQLALLRGNSISLLKGERTALNFLQRMSGIATLTQKFVRAVEGTKIKILDTRKTTPGLRELEKYAVRMGGGTNHRFNLSEMVLIKDNHLKIVGSISESIRRARKCIPSGVKIEVETTNMDEMKEAFQSGADWIMLDNWTMPDVKKAVLWIDGRVPLEFSGKIDLLNIKEASASGVDYISVGRLTHSFKSLDISMEFQAGDRGV